MFRGLAPKKNRRPVKDGDEITVNNFTAIAL